MYQAAWISFAFTEPPNFQRSNKTSLAQPSVDAKLNSLGLCILKFFPASGHETRKVVGGEETQQHPRMFSGSDGSRVKDRNGNNSVSNRQRKV